MQYASRSPKLNLKTWSCSNSLTLLSANSSKQLEKAYIVYVCGCFFFFFLNL